MRVGTFGVIDSIDTKPFALKLNLIKQDNVLRAVPFQTKDSVPIIPGRVTKDNFAQEIAEEIVKRETK